jgi:excisionase family DNA binding protein
MSLTTQFAKWLRQQLAHLDELEADPRDTLASCESLADVISEAGRRAAAAGLPDVVKTCQIRSGPVGTDLARRVLAACLGACQPADEQTTLTIKQAASRVGVSADTVRDWITSKQLKASNIGKGKVKARYRIAVTDLDAFMVGRKPGDVTPPRRKAAASFQRDFS